MNSTDILIILLIAEVVGIITILLLIIRWIIAEWTDDNELIERQQERSNLNTTNKQ